MAAPGVNFGDLMRDAARQRQAAGGAGPRLPGAQPGRPAGRHMGIGDFQPLGAGQGIPGMPPGLDPEMFQQMLGAAMAGGGFPGMGMPDLAGLAGIGGLGGIGGGLGPLPMFGGMPGLGGLMGMMPPEVQAQIQGNMQDVAQRIGTIGLILTSTPAVCMIALLVKNIMVINPMTDEYSPQAGMGEKMLARLFFLEASLHCLASFVYNLCLTLFTTIAVIVTLGQVKPIFLACKKFIVITGLSFLGFGATVIGIAAPTLGTNAVRGCFFRAMQNLPSIHNFVS